MVKKQQEADNYLCLISMFSDYEKYTLMEYADNDYNKVVFFNPKNSELCLKLLNLVTFKIILERRIRKSLYWSIRLAARGGNRCRSDE
jgi:hypothetical protein